MDDSSMKLFQDLKIIILSQQKSPRSQRQSHDDSQGKQQKSAGFGWY